MSCKVQKHEGSRNSSHKQEAPTNPLGKYSYRRTLGLQLRPKKPLLGSQQEIDRSQKPWIPIRAPFKRARNPSVDFFSKDLEEDNPVEHASKARQYRFDQAPSSSPKGSYQPTRNMYSYSRIMGLSYTIYQIPYTIYYIHPIKGPHIFGKTALWRLASQGLPSLNPTHIESCLAWCQGFRALEARPSLVVFTNWSPIYMCICMYVCIYIYALYRYTDR